MLPPLSSLMCYTDVYKRQHKRNLTDDQLKTLGNAGGVVGINFESSFLKEGSHYATVDQIITHLNYMVDKAGIEHVGFGSDFDGIDTTGEPVSYTHLACWQSSSVFTRS